MTSVLAEQGVDINDVLGVFVANRIALAAALDEVDMHGGTEAFLLSRGLPADVPPDCVTTCWCSRPGYSALSSMEAGDCSVAEHRSCRTKRT
jgi:hypothetical protein